MDLTEGVRIVAVSIFQLWNLTSVAGRSRLERLLALRPRIAAGVPLIGDAHALTSGRRALWNYRSDAKVRRTCHSRMNNRRSLAADRQPVEDWLGSYFNGFTRCCGAGETPITFRGRSGHYVPDTLVIKIKLWRVNTFIYGSGAASFN